MSFSSVFQPFLPEDKLSAYSQQSRCSEIPWKPYWFWLDAFFSMLFYMLYCPSLYLRNVSWAVFNLVRTTAFLGHVFLSHLEVFFFLLKLQHLQSFLERHYGLSRSKYPDMSLRNSLKERNIKTNSNVIASFSSREQILYSAGAILANFFLYNTNCWLLYCIHIFQKGTIPFSFQFSFQTFCSFCLKAQGST